MLASVCLLQIITGTYLYEKVKLKDFCCQGFASAPTPSLAILMASSAECRIPWDDLTCLISMVSTNC
jgi:hypothetical protein